jgi:hypothetical protein
MWALKTPAAEEFPVFLRFPRREPDVYGLREFGIALKRQIRFNG